MLHLYQIQNLWNNVLLMCVYIYICLSRCAFWALSRGNFHVIWTLSITRCWGCVNWKQVSYLTRLRRPSSLSSSKAGVKQLWGIKDNFLYDVDSATRALSSDSDCPPRTSSQAPNAKSEEIIVQNFKHSLVGDQKTRHAKSSNNVDKLTNQYQTFLQESPVGENSPNEIFDTES